MARGHVWPYRTYGTPYAVYGERTYLMGGGVQMWRLATTAATADMVRLGERLAKKGVR